ncbi:ABC transporter substrate-binding protein [Paenibacillus sp. OAS669]|uniref:ABC transporter substrate-binding protein n=1 Tax=Paenibacillus sp. OAS669 TaxID=2663821 RepID=UPI00178B4A8D|nr:substrate-binding domain-containing protein [Paenibacillus sp. OAS669]MBE1442559.1 iron(III) transport system substrate-binding protein [Paenibacillus sp. OAS669]
MKKARTTCALLAAFSIVIAACSTSTPKASTDPAANRAAAAASGQGKSEWAERNGLYKTETVDELYEKAKKEGKVTVYSTSGRINDVEKTFEAKYPGIQVEAFDLKSNVIMDKVIREQAAGIFNADLVLTKEVGGGIEEELVKKGMLFKYLPDDIAKHIYEPWRSKGIAFVPYLEFRTLFYNTEQNKTPPVNNWWDLTTPEWKNRVLMVDPMQSPTQMDMFVGFVVNSDEMAKAYKEKFGTDIVLNGTPNAGYEFLQRFYKNVILVKSSGDGQDAVGKAAPNKPAPVFIGVSGDIRKMADKGLKADIIWDMKPRLSVVDEGLLFVGNKAPHPNAAKLLLRWMAGEADGKGEGTAPFNEVGSWMTRDDVKHKNSKNINELNVWQYDSEKFYKVYQDVVNFWIKNQ